LSGAWLAVAQLQLLRKPPANRRFTGLKLPVFQPVAGKVLSRVLLFGAAADLGSPSD